MSTLRRTTALAAAGLLTFGGAAAAQAYDYAGSYPHDPAANQGDYWVGIVTDLGYTDVSCTKVADDYQGETWTADQDYAAVIIKAGAGEAANDLYTDVIAGESLGAQSGKNISHVIACTGTMPEEETPGTDEPGDDDTPETPGTDEPGDDETPDTPGTDEPGEDETPGTPEQPGKPGDDAGKPIGPVVQTDVPAKGINPAVPAGAVLAAAAGLGLAAAGLKRREQH